MAFLENLQAFFLFIGNFIKGMTLALWYIIKALVLFFVPKCLRAKDVSNDIVLITGGASGLGRLMAIKFAKLGAKVVIWDLNQAGLEETAKMVEELRSKRENVGKCHHYLVDISRRENVYAAADRVKQEVGSVSIVVNNAGIVTGKRFLECEDAKIVKTFDVNVLAHFWILKAFLPDMMEKNHGHIVSIASIAGLIGAYQLTDYCASKFAAVGLEDSLRLELNCDGYDGIHSTVVCPYYINTGMFSGIGRSLIPILTPQYVVDEAVKAILVNQEVLCLPAIVNWLVCLKTILPAKAFVWSHRALGCASTMKTFTGRRNENQTALLAKETDVSGEKGGQVAINMMLNKSPNGGAQPPSIGITIPERGQPLNQ